MTWKKVVRVVGVSVCPVCGNPAFNFEPGADVDDPHALVRCGKCGHVCTADQFHKPVAESNEAGS
jgi:ferredoxin